MKKPLYKKIYDSILQKILNGELLVGDKLPSEKELAVGFQVSRITSKNALDLLAQNNYIKRVQGKGSYVLEIPTVIQDDIKADMGEFSRMNIGLVMPSFSDSYGAEIILAVERYAKLKNMNVFIKFTYEKIENEVQAIDDLLVAGVQGLIVLPIHGEHYNPSILELVLKDFPIVLIDRYLKGILANSITTDNEKASHTATHYLFDQNHQNLAYVTPSDDGTTVLVDRLKGFQTAHIQRGVTLNPEYIVTNLASDYILHARDDEKFKIEKEKLREFIINHPEVTAFLACRYSLAIILEEVIQSLYKTVPEDYSLICFDSPPSLFEKPDFTHINQNEDKIGREVIEILGKKINNYEGVINKVIAPTLVEGKSTRKIE